MKVLLCFIIATVLVSPTFQKGFEQYESVCKNKTGLSEDAVNKLHRDDFVDDPKLADFVLCVLKKMKFINDSGEFQVDEIRPVLVGDAPTEKGDEYIAKVITKCAVKRDTPQESALQFMKCVRNKSD